MTKRIPVCKKTYFDADRVESNSPQGDSVGLAFHTLSLNDAGETVVDSVHTLELADLDADVLTQGTLMGFAQKIGDAYGSKERRDEHGLAEIIDTMIERLKNGDWTASGNALGARPSRLIDALSNVIAKRDGVEVEDLTDETLLKIRDALAGEGGEKSAMQNTAVKAEYARLSAEAAVERAKKAKGNVVKGDDSFIDSL